MTNDQAFLFAIVCLVIADYLTHMRIDMLRKRVKELEDKS